MIDYVFYFVVITNLVFIAFCLIMWYQDKYEKPFNIKEEEKQIPVCKNRSGWNCFSFKERKPKVSRAKAKPKRRSNKRTKRSAKV